MYLSLYTFLIGRRSPGPLHISKMMYGAAFTFNKKKNFLKLNHLFTGTNIRRETSENVYIYSYCPHIHTRSDTHTHKETSPIAREPRVEGERQTDGYRICSDLSQCYKAQLDRFIQYMWTHLQVLACSYPPSENVGLQK
jgi:hypothetical protein